MKNSRVLPFALPLALMGQLISGNAWAQGSGKNVTIFRMAGPQLGVRLEEVDADVVSRLKLREEKGALVTEVLRDSAAEKAGIRRDDVILKFQGESVLTAAQLSRLVRDVPSGRKVDVDIIRAGAPLKLTATLQKGEWSNEGADMPDMADLNERLAEKMSKLGDMKFKMPKGEAMPRSFNFQMGPDGPGFTGFAQAGRGRLGITYTEIEGQLAHYFKAPKESAILVNSVVEGSAAQKAGLKAGDLITKLGGVSIEDADDLRDAVSALEGGREEHVTVWRDGRAVELSVTVENEPRTRSSASRLRQPRS